MGHNFSPRIIFPVGVFATLFVAYFLDRWLLTHTRLARAEGNSFPLFLWTIVSGGVLYASWLALSWITLTRSRRSTPVSAVVLIVGFLLFIYPYLYLTWTWLPTLFVMERTPLAYTGLFVAVLSILHLLVTIPLDNESQN
jgi:hypothetical protein